MITNFDYTLGTDGPIFWWVERKNGKATVHKEAGLVPHFYVPPGQAVRVNPPKMTGWERSCYFDPLCGPTAIPVDMVKVKFPHDTYDVRPAFAKAGVPTFEADRLFPEVAAELKGWTPDMQMGEPRRHCYFDIEIDSTADVPIGNLIQHPEAAVMCITAIDSFTKEITVFRLGDGGSGYDELGGYRFKDITYVTEQELLQAFFRYCRFRLFDTYTGWYSSGGVDKYGKKKYRRTSGFDVPYLIARARACRVNPSIWSPCEVAKIRFQPEDGAYYSQVKLASLVDLMYFAKYSGKLKIRDRAPPDYKLDTIGRMFLGLGKINQPSNFTKLYKERTMDAVLYNIRDTVMLMELEDKFRFIADYVGMLKYCIMYFPSVIFATRVLDRLTMRKAHERGVVLPTRAFKRDEDEEYIPTVRTTGADVFNPDPAIHEDVATYDGKGMYPNLVRALNVGFETKDENGPIVAPNGVRFKSSPRSLLASIYDEADDEKKRYKKILANIEPGTDEFFYNKACYMAAKGVVNASVGALGSIAARVFDPENFNAVTTGGVAIINTMREVAEDNGLHVITGDTDSILPHVEFSEAEKIVPLLNTGIEKLMKGWNALSYVEADMERFSKRMIIGVRKRRAEWVTWEDGKDTDYILIRGLEVIRRESSPWMAECQKNFLETLLREGKGPAIKKIKSWFKSIPNIPPEQLCDWAPVRDADPNGNSQNVAAARNSARRYNFKLEPLETPQKIVSKSGVYAFRDTTWGLVPDVEHYNKIFKQRLGKLLELTGEIWPTDRIETLDGYAGLPPKYVDIKKAVKNKRKRNPQPLL